MPILKYKINGQWVELSGGASGSGVEVDASLSIEGAAADAKATGDAIVGLGEALGEALGTVVTQEQLTEALTPVLETVNENSNQIATKQSKVHFNTTEPTDWVNGDIWLKPAE